MNSLERLANAIRTARMARGMSQEYLAELLDVTPTHVRHMESGHRKPSIEVLFQLAQILDLSLDSLIFEDRPEIPAIHTNGLTPDEIGAVSRLVDLMRAKKQQH